eukprot:780536_1
MQCVVTSYTKLRKISDFVSIVFVQFLKMSNFSKDFMSCKLYFVLLNLLRSDLFNLRDVFWRKIAWICERRRGLNLESNEYKRRTIDSFARYYWRQSGFGLCDGGALDGLIFIFWHYFARPGSVLHAVWAAGCDDHTNYATLSTCISLRRNDIRSSTPRRSMQSKYETKTQDSSSIDASLFDASSIECSSHQNIILF